MKYVKNDSYVVVGKPSPLYNDTDTDWDPTRNLGQEKSKILPTPVKGVRVRERKEKSCCVDAARSLLSVMNSKGMIYRGRSSQFLEVPAVRRKLVLWYRQNFVVRQSFQWERS